MRGAQEKPDLVEGIACASTVTGRVLLGAAAYLTWGVPGEFDDVKGAEHPTTLSSRSSLAYSYSCADQVAEAIDVCEGMLPECQRVLGPEHPFTKQVKNILEMARREMNQSTASSE